MQRCVHLGTVFFDRPLSAYVSQSANHMRHGQVLWRDRNPVIVVPQHLLQLRPRLSLRLAAARRKIRFPAAL